MKYRDTKEGLLVKLLGVDRRATIQKRHDLLNLVDVVWVDTGEIQERISPSELEPAKSKTEPFSQ